MSTSGIMLGISLGMLLGPSMLVTSCCCVCSLNSYTANLAANLTAKRLSGTIASLTDLAASNGMFGVPADSSISNFFRTSSDSDARQLQPRMVEYSSFTDAAAAVRWASGVCMQCTAAV